MTSASFNMPVKRKGNHLPAKQRRKRMPRTKVKAAEGNSTTNTKTKNKAKGQKGDLQSGEQSFYSKADGRPMKKSLANVYKILSASTAKNWYECNAVNPLWGVAAEDTTHCIVIRLVQEPHCSCQ